MKTSAKTKSKTTAMSTKQVQAMAMAMALGMGGWIGCAEPADEPVNESTKSSALGECDTDWVCGSNSPQIDHRGFHELSLQGYVNLEGLALHLDLGTRLPKLIKNNVTYELRVINSKIVGYFGGAPALSNANLVGAEIPVREGRSEYVIHIESVRQISYAFNPPSQPNDPPPTLHSYIFSWSGMDAPHNPRRALCDAVTLLRDPSHVPPNADSPPLEPNELFGMAPGETLVFGKDRINGQAKTMNALPDSSWINFGCAGHTLAKLHLTRNTLASGSLDHPGRQATLKMLTGDYCGTGRSFAVAGEPLYWKSSAMPYYLPPTTLEARWNEHGAMCLSDPRLARTTSPDVSTFFPPPLGVLGAITSSCSLMPCTDPTNFASFYGALRVSGNP